MNHPVSPMYLWAVGLLSALAAISSYILHVFPFPLMFAVVVAALIEILIRKYYLKHKFKIPFSGIITGLIIGSVAPINAPLVLVLIAAAIAIASKFFIQFKGSNIFNPAALGLIVALAIFGLGDEWWAAGNYNLYGVAISLTPVLIILAYEARRLPTALSFVAVSLVLNLALAGFHVFSVAAIAALLFSVNYYFAFVMLVEPKTSPYNRYMQIGYGASIAALYPVLAFFRTPYPLLVVLLAGNIAYLLYRRSGKR